MRKLILFALLSASLVFGSEKKLKALFVIHSDGSTEIKTFDGAKSADGYRTKRIAELYDETVGAWEKLGKKGPKPLRPIVRKIEDLSPADLKPNALREITENARKKFEKDIVKMLDNQKERDEALIGKEGLEELKKSNWQNPPGPLRIPERKIPEKYFPLTWIENIVFSVIQPSVVKFWCAAEAAPGWDPQQPVRMVVRLSTELRYRKELETREILAAIKDSARHIKDVDKGGPVTSIWVYHDPYRVDIVPDGKWREYTVRVEFEFWSALGANPQHSAWLVFATADPAIYYLDDVSVEGDGLRMKAPDIIAAYRDRAIEERGKNTPAEEDEGKKMKDIKKEVEFEATGPIPIAKLANGNFNQIFGEFFLGWKFDERDEPIVVASRMNGWRGQEKNPDAKPKGRGDRNEEVTALTSEYYAKLDASKLEPDKLSMQSNRQGYLDFAIRSGEGGPRKTEDEKPDGEQKRGKRKKNAPDEE